MLKSESVGGAASQVSAHPAVREALIERQRRFADQPGGAVLDGRDIGTVIAPHAHAKLFVTASPEVRAERRHRELEALGAPMHFEAVLTDILARDARDSHRATAPLRQAEDAVLLDTGGLSVEEAIARAIEAVERRAGR
jgi:cytidylate kinase